MKLRDWLNSTADQFRSLGLSHPLSETEIMTSGILNFSRPELLAKDKNTLSESDFARLQQALERRLAGEPLAYILGYKDFYRSRFLVGPGVLIPRPETELVVDLALDLVGASARVADFGAGSGAIGFSILHERSEVDLVAVEKSERAFYYLAQNLKNLGLRAKLVQSSVEDFSTQIENQNSFDAVVANPPYIGRESAEIEDAVKKFEPHEALFADESGLKAHRQFNESARRILKKGAWYISEIGYDQAEQVKILLSDFDHVEIKRDLSGRDRVVLARR